MRTRPVIKSIGALLCALITVINFSPPIRHLRNLDSTVYYRDNYEKLSVLAPLNNPLLSAEDVPVGVSSDERLRDEVTVSLFGLIPIKTVKFTPKDNITLVPCGHSIGITIDTDGLLVVGMGDVVTDANGSSVKSPAKQAGVRIGDYIISANGKKLENSDALSEICASSSGNLTLSVKRGNDTHSIKVKPAYDKRSETYKLGIWVREDTAGIGTLSYYDPEAMTFAALGHPVTDIDTGNVFTVDGGFICDCEILGITKGRGGTPGELTGAFSSSYETYGSVLKNTEFGVFGNINSTESLKFTYSDGLPLAYPDELHTGSASILCSTDGEEVKEYSCSIVKLSKQDNPAIKGIVIEVTDEELLSETGGIVQGMSGSPIIQDGKLAGVVTHVMINNPKRGYGISAYWMYVNQ